MNKNENSVLHEIDEFLELAKAFSGQNDLITLLSLVKEKAIKIMNADRGSIFLIDKKTNELWTLMSDGVNVIRFPFGKGIVGSVIKNNEVLNIKDAEKDSRFYSEIDKQTGYKTNSILCVPMRNRFGDAVGAVEVLNKYDGTFTDYDEKILTILGTQAAVAIENVEMLDDYIENVKQLDLLNRIQNKANAFVDIDSILEMTAKEVNNVLNSDYVVVFRFHDSGTPICSYCLSPDNTGTLYEDEFTDNLDNRFGDLFKKVPERVISLKNENIFSTPDNGVVVAIKGNRDLMGYIEVAGIKQNDRLFNERTMNFLEIVAGQIISFIKNRKLVEEKARGEKLAAVGNMVSSIVHDVKNPLCGISGYVQLIKNKSDNNKIKKFSDIVLSELERLQQMNNELLTFVRGDKIELELKEIDANQFISDVVEIVKADLDIKNIELILDNKIQSRISIDINKMKRVFVNIINNAIDAMPEGGKLNIITEDVGGDLVSFTIRDNGKGMRSDVKARLFEPFFSFGKKNGTGLGMAITRDIVIEHKGGIHVESELGKGTGFIIKLPIK